MVQNERSFCAKRFINLRRLIFRSQPIVFSSSLPLETYLIKVTSAVFQIPLHHRKYAARSEGLNRHRTQESFPCSAWPPPGVRRWGKAKSQGVNTPDCAYCISMLCTRGRLPTLPAITTKHSFSMARAWAQTRTRE